MRQEPGCLGHPERRGQGDSSGGPARRRPTPGSRCLPISRSRSVPRPRRVALSGRRGQVRRRRSSQVGALQVPPLSGPSWSTTGGRPPRAAVRDSGPPRGGARAALPPCSPRLASTQLPLGWTSGPRESAVRRWGGGWRAAWVRRRRRVGDVSGPVYPAVALPQTCPLWRSCLSQPPGIGVG